MIQGIELLEADEQTKVIVLISKPPAPGTMERVLEVARRCRKPVVVNFLGGDLSPTMLGKLRSANTLDEASRIACELAGMKPTDAAQTISTENISIALEEHAKLASSQQYIRGLFSGGTLCYESETILLPLLGEVFSNAPIKPEDKVPGDASSKKLACIDMGAEEFVEGRLHPMIDFSLRNMRILQEAKDPETAVILLDVELGYGSNPDPAGQLVPAIEKAKDIAKKAGRHLSVVASVVGTEGDFQGLANQEKALSEAGVLIMPSNAQATRISALIAAGKNVEATIFRRSE